MAKDGLHERLIAIVNSLPGAYEDRPWGSVHCKVDGKIFTSWGKHDDGRWSVGFKTVKELQAMLIASDPRFVMADYVGKHGWIRMQVGDKPDMAELEHFIVESYKMIAPKKRLKELAGGPSAPVAKKAAATTKRVAAKKKSAAKKKVVAKRPVSKPKKASKRARR